MGWRQWRDRVLGDPAVRDRLAAMPFGAAIADAHAGRLFGMMTGFAASRMFHAAIELDLFTLLAARPRTPAAIADAAALPPRGARALIGSMAASGLWAERDGLVSLTVDGLVVASEPGIVAMARHDALLAADLADPVAMLRDAGAGRLGAFWPYRGGGDAAAYGAVMAASHRFAGEQLCATHDFGRYRHVMDVGGGDGAFLRALAARWPHLVLTLVDLPAAIARAVPLLADLPKVRLEARRPGEPLPSGADAITLVRVLHDLDDTPAAGLISAAVAALGDRGRLIVAEPMRRRGRDPVAAYFAAYLAAMGSGRLRSPSEVGGMLRAAGLGRVRTRPRLLLTTMIGVKTI